MRKQTLLTLGFTLLLSACATLGPTSFKQSAKSYDADFDQVWKAALAAVSDQSVDRADKELRQITTLPVKASNILGDIERKTTIKISEARPYSVSVMVSAAKTTTAAARGGSRGLSQTDTFSDQDEERRILALIDQHLGRR